MNTRNQFQHSMRIVLPLFFLTAGVLAADERISVQPNDNGAALVNPDMGWVFHYYDNVPAHYGSKLLPSDTLDDWPGLSVIYLRIPWSYIEPEEGRFNWSVLDTPAQRWVDKGKQIALRISCSESWTRWATPEWVQKAGAKGYDFRPGKGVQPDGPFWEPDFDDPIFLEKLDHLLAALAARYGGNPEVAFIDVGSLGVWGEGHTGASTRRPILPETVKKHIDLHKKHFSQTLLATNDDLGGHNAAGENEVMQYAVEHGLTLRDDSILVQPAGRAWFHAAWAQPFWPRVPVILESEHYGGSKVRGNWQDGSLYLKAIEEYRASYASIHWWPHEFLQENRDLVRRINLRLGYRLQLTEATWPKTVRARGSFSFTGTWQNAGVAPCYPGGHPAITLKDQEGGTVGVFVDDAFDVRTLSVAGPEKTQSQRHEATFQLPFQLVGGEYAVFVSIGTRTGTPTIALPLDGDDGLRRYRIGTIRVVGDYGVEVGTLERRGDVYVLPLTWTTHTELPKDVRPFCHFDRGGQIAFQGHPQPETELDQLRSPGVAKLACEFQVPREARGQKYSVHVGLWSPSRQGTRNHEERMLPDRGAADRRVMLGELTVNEGGIASFTIDGSI